jgi:hypothetical protein
MDGRLTAILALTGLWLANGEAFAAPLPKPIATNKTRFRIPFKFDAAALQRMNARELQLHVSADRGLTWQVAQTLAPDGGKFEYQAPQDGEFWFAVKTLDGRNQLHPPAGSYETGLIVVVDTTQPLLDISLKQIVPGTVQLSWQAADANLDPSTLKLEYHQPGSQGWDAVEVAPRASGQTTWHVAQSGPLAVRGTVTDVAANIGRGQSQLQIVAVGEPAPAPKTNRRVPIAGLEDGNEQAAVTGQSFPIVPHDPLATSRPPTFRAPVEQQPIGGGYRGPVIMPFGGQAIQNPIEQFVSSTPATKPEITQDRWSGNPEPVAAPSAPIQHPAATPIQYPPAAPIQHPPARLRVVSTRKFQVGYKIDDVGPSGIGGVEMFITQDNGHKWWKYGEDPDQRSPFDVEVPQDGEYGFAIRVRSGVGLANDPPIPGEAPAIVVAIDQTPPTVELLPVQQGQGSSVNRVQIRWRIQDDRPSDKPVSLYYSSNRQGPWEPIVGWKEDEGSYEWTVGPGVPTQLFLRVVARDLAGNTSKAESTTPIVIDLSRPSARIVDIEMPQTSGPQ